LGVSPVGVKTRESRDRRGELYNAAVGDGLCIVELRLILNIIFYCLIVQRYNSLTITKSGNHNVLCMNHI